LGVRLLNNPRLVEGVVFTLLRLSSVLLPQQTVQPARSSKINATNVNQNAGAVSTLEFGTPSKMCLSLASTAISTAKAMSVMSAERKLSSDEMSVTVRCSLKLRRNATKMIAVAIGVMIKPLVYDAPRDSVVGEPEPVLTRKLKEYP